MNEYKGLKYWLQLGTNDKIQSAINEHLKLLTQDESANLLLDLSIGLELIGNEQSTEMQKQALENTVEYYLLPRENKNELRFLRKMYDACTGYPLAADPTVTVFKAVGSVINNMQIELYCSNVFLQILYITDDFEIPNLNTIIFAIAPLQDNAKLLQCLVDILDEISIPNSILNHPKNLLKLLPNAFSQLISQIKNIHYLDTSEQIASLQSTDGFFYEYNIFYVNGSFYLHSINIGKNFDTLHSQQEMNSNPKLYLTEKSKMREFTDFKFRHKDKLDIISKKLSLDIFIFSCVEWGDNQLTITSINTNQVLSTKTNPFYSHRKPYIVSICNAISDTFYYPKDQHERP